MTDDHDEGLNRKERKGRRRVIVTRSRGVRGELTGPADRPESGPMVCGAGILPAVLSSYSAGPRRTPIAGSMSQLCKSQRIVVKPRISRLSQLSRIKALPLAYIRAISVISGYSARVPDITLCNECKCAWIVFATRSSQKLHQSMGFFYRKLDVSLIAI